MKVSIITVCFNSSATIHKTIKSVNSQSYKNIEHIFVDGNSKDGTRKIILSKSKRATKLISESDHGIYDAMNKGIKFSSGQIIGILNSDDFYFNCNVIENVVKEIKRQSSDCLYGDLVYINQKRLSKIVRYWVAGEFNKQRIKFGWMPPHPTVFLMRKIYDDLGYFNTNYKISADYDFILRLLVREGLKITYLPKILVKMRLGGASNRSFKRIFIKSYEDYLILRKNYSSSIFTLFFKNLRKISQFY
jgi:glycosyltransferase